MKIEDFSIGHDFTNATGVVWRCTDKGSRTILAIEINDDRDPAWFIGPPYVVEEVIFDERAMSGCFTSLVSALAERLEDRDHPGFPGDAVKHMMETRRNNRASYPNSRLLRYDRLNSKGEIAHPYAAGLVGDTWIIQVYYVYTEEFSVVPESDFIKWPVATAEDYKVSKSQYL